MSIQIKYSTNHCIKTRRCINENTKFQDFQEIVGEENLPFLYNDDKRDRIILANEEDLKAAIEYAKTANVTLDLYPLQRVHERQRKCGLGFFIAGLIVVLILCANLFHAMPGLLVAIAIIGGVLAMKRRGGYVKRWAAKWCNEHCNNKEKAPKEEVQEEAGQVQKNKVGEENSVFLYKEQLKSLIELGFHNVKQNIEELKKAGGDLNVAIQKLLE